MTSDSDITPQDRLAASRQTILNLMNARGENPASSYEHIELGSNSGKPVTKLRPATSKWQMIQRAMRVWWHNHPANLALEVGRPVLGKYAKEEPLKLLGISAAAGAAIALLKPWRLISVTGLGVAALKSSQVSGLLLSLLTTPPETSTQDNHK